MSRLNNDEFEDQGDSQTPDSLSAYDQMYGSENNFGQSAPQSEPDADSPQDQPQQPFPGATWTVQPASNATKSKSWIVALVAIVLVFVLLFFGIASCTTTLGSFSLGSVTGTSSSDEKASLESMSNDTIGIIQMSGDIEYDGSVCSPEGFKDQLDIAASNSHIKAVVLRVDSGGGTAAAGEEMVAYLRDFMATTGKPVVVSSASMNSSAAYMISSQADYIYTLEATSIGGIGTLMQFTNLEGFYEQLGIEVDNIASSDSKDSTYGTRALTEEERAYYQSLVDQINNTFIEDVAEGRNMSIDEVRELATGLIFTGSDAVSNHLADELGTLDDAIDKAYELSHSESETYEVVYLQPASNDIYDLLSLLGTEEQTNEETSLGKLK